MHGRLLAITALALVGRSAPASDCELPGEPVHWIADHCMLRLETDDEIAAADCIARELGRSSGPSCDVKRRFKRAMCETLVQRKQRESVAARLRDPAMQGSTVRSGGVGR